MSKYKLIFEEPPVLVLKKPKPKKPRETLSGFLHMVAEKHPQKWVRVLTNYPSPTHLYKLRAQEFPNMEIVTRKQKDGTYHAYVRFVDHPVKVQRRKPVAELAKPVSLTHYNFATGHIEPA